MAVVIHMRNTVGSDVVKTFGGLECDVEGCEALTQSALAEGWFVGPGLHRCPAHFNTEAPARGPQHRLVEQPTKKI